MSKVISAVLALTAAATLGISTAQAGGYGHSSSSLVSAKVNVGGVASVKANVGTTSRGGDSLLGLNVSTGNLLNVKADVGSTSSHGSSSLLGVSASVGGSHGLLNANVNVGGSSSHQIEHCDACSGGHEGGVGEW